MPSLEPEILQAVRAAYILGGAEASYLVLAAHLERRSRSYSLSSTNSDQGPALVLDYDAADLSGRIRLP